MYDEFFGSVIKESVGRTYATDSEEEAEWDSLFGVLWVTLSFQKVLVLRRCLSVGFVWRSVWMWLLLRWTWTSRKGSV